MRFLTDDHPAQCDLVSSLFEECRRREEHLYLTLTVLCETVWVLEDNYSQPKESIVKALEEVLDTDLFEFERPEVALRSLERFKAGRADFSDYVVAELGAAAGCRDLLTFDKVLSREPGVTTLR